MKPTNETKQITVLIGGRPYSLKIQATDEASITRIVQEINTKIDDFQVTYPHREQKDCMALSLLSYAIDLYKCSQNKSESVSAKSPEVQADLAKIDTLLDKILKE